MNIAHHLYELKSAEPLGARSQGRVRQGALLRIQKEGGEIGYADLHPWAELGDLPLAEQLTGLARGETTALSEASLAFAALDAQARANRVSLWSGLTVPESHFLLPSIDESGYKLLEAALTEGFTHFKIKLGKDLDLEKPRLLKLCKFIGDLSVTSGDSPKLRLDYNETLTAAQFAEYFAGLEELQPCIDFIEDPFPFQAAEWSEISARFGVSFALDRAGMIEAALGFEGIRIHKPALAGPSGVPERHTGRLVVTSYLDHPLGQLCAAWVAAHLTPEARNERHGLVSHRVYARNQFSEQLGWNGPRLSVPEGTGFGFDEELAALDWKLL
ncbi:MAG: hypothetical protein ACRYFS_19460 [Janthinobacterium lividum]